MDGIILKADAERIPLPDRSVDLVVGSPPYVDCRTYLEDGVDMGIARDLEEWVAWMLRVTAECLRVSRGAVIWVAAGKTEDRNYWPACEMLMADWYRRGGSMYRPCYWHRTGIQGSGGDQWFRADVEYAMCFKRDGRLPWTDNIACGQPPKYPPGGKMTNRMKDGKRCYERNWKFNEVNDPRQLYTQPDIANPGNLIRTNNGGGALGSDLAHDNEAPFPEDLAAFFIKSLCPPGGLVLGPFGGSGTELAVCVLNGRRFVSCDLRGSQAALQRRRYAEAVQRRDNPHKQRRNDKPAAPLPGQMSFLEPSAL